MMRAVQVAVGISGHSHEEAERDGGGAVKTAQIPTANDTGPAALDADRQHSGRVRRLAGQRGLSANGAGMRALQATLIQR
jgi:hypothetical protein